ncbi:2362_t:CDS:2 [Funneliformis geosporum]|nr:2362_t:CDS:2 [Funneliformis geosporum]
MESSLSRKRKANEIDDEYDMDKVWGIVTDAEKWNLWNGMKDMTEKVLGHILWLLEEAQKL